jgi:hypothetical protein
MIGDASPTTRSKCASASGTSRRAHLHRIPVLFLERITVGRRAEDASAASILAVPDAGLPLPEQPTVLRGEAKRASPASFATEQNRPPLSLTVAAIEIARNPICKATSAIVPVSQNMSRTTELRSSRQLSSKHRRTSFSGRTVAATCRALSHASGHRAEFVGGFRLAKKTSAR